MATSILPDRFTDGDFSCWLRHFERCALANNWNEATKLLKLPAFLQGPAASYYDALADDERDTYNNVVASLTKSFSPAVNRERFYSDFEQQILRPTEDPSLYLWRLKEILRNAEPDLSQEASEVLLRRQFLKGLPASLRLKLLESDPTSDLPKMLSFAQRFRALEALPCTSPNPSCAAVNTPLPPDESSPVTSYPPSTPQQPQIAAEQQQRLLNLERLVSKMVEDQRQFIAAVSPSTADHLPQRRLSTRCFICHDVGHNAKDCAARRGIMQCTLCHGWGHSSLHCANHSSSNHSRKFPSLNFQGVPR